MKVKSLLAIVALLALTLPVEAAERGNSQPSEGVSSGMVQKEYEITIPFARDSVRLDETDSLTAVRMGKITKSVSASYERDDSYVFQMTIRGYGPTQEIAEQRAIAVKTWIRTLYPSQVKLQALRTQTEVADKDAVTVSYMILSQN